MTCGPTLKRDAKLRKLSNAELVLRYNTATKNVNRWRRNLDDIRFRKMLCDWSRAFCEIRERVRGDRRMETVPVTEIADFIVKHKERA